MPESSTPTRDPLDRLVGSGATLLADHWSKKAGIFASGVDPGTLVSSEEIWDRMEFGLLIDPYFRCLTGAGPARNLWRTRTVAGSSVPEYPDTDKVRRAYAEGATIQLNRVDHWHEGVRDLLDGLAPFFEGGLTACLFLSPPGKPPTIKPHLDGAHVLVLQLEGTKDWMVGDPSTAGTSYPAFCDAPFTGSALDTTLFETTLEAGQVLYLPLGSPHCALATSSTSLHLSIEVKEPTVRDLAEVYAARCPAGDRQGGPRDPLERARQAVIGHLTEVDDREVIGRTADLIAQRLRSY